MHGSSKSYRLRVFHADWLLFLFVLFSLLLFSSLSLLSPLCMCSSSLLLVNAYGGLAYLYLAGGEDWQVLWTCIFAYISLFHGAAIHRLGLRVWVELW